MLLPARMAVLNYLSSVENADVNEIMEAMRPLYGKERQFTKDAYLDHVMSLEANGLCSLIRYELDDKDELSLRFAINDDGRSAVEKYVPAKYRNK
ncbi:MULTISPECIES: hypothetical protein [Eubacteriales]|uniref:hypothetical protein n=1 Tax=Eubacteriales TaxID=186802 RepID=UPI000B372E70|nr:MULTISPECIES: hypothetical protein [Eubacteriales]MDY4166782.1 hypothetical protein [Fournierella sp.]OUN86384.1 hypothetical protein B5G03_08380 [Gemmiger sp. An50]OUP24063.1 hypothetical protein B5F28_08350 [Gemmiger sp. An194]